MMKSATLGGKIFVVPNPNKHQRYINTVSKLLQENQVDVVHNEIFFGGGLNLWLGFARAGVKKRIAHSHATSDSKGNRFPYSVVRPIFNNLMMKYATDFIGVCSDEAGIGLFGKEQPFVMLPNGIDLDRYRNVPVTKAEMHAQLGIPEDAFVIGHIGRFEEQKNHRLLLKIVQHILKKHPNTYLLSVGAGSLEAEIHGLANDLGISDHVLFLGEREDIAELLKAMDVFLLPSLYEGLLPIVAVEAQAANVKLVMSTEVSEDTVLSENVRFVPLDADLDRWEAEVMGEPKAIARNRKWKLFDMLKTGKALEKNLQCEGGHGMMHLPTTKQLKEFLKDNKKTVWLTALAAAGALCTGHRLHLIQQRGGGGRTGNRSGYRSGVNLITGEEYSLLLHEGAARFEIYIENDEGDAFTNSALLGYVVVACRLRDDRYGRKR